MAGPRQVAGHYRYSLNCCLEMSPHTGDVRRMFRSGTLCRGTAHRRRLESNDRKNGTLAFEFRDVLNFPELKKS